MSEFTCPELVTCTSLASRVSEGELSSKKSTSALQSPPPVEGRAGVNSVEEKQETSSANEFTVVWDGDDDPLCPRSMSYIRKWIIVSIVSAGSLLV